MATPEIEHARIQSRKDAKIIVDWQQLEIAE